MCKKYDGAEQYMRELKKYTVKKNYQQRSQYISLKVCNFSVYVLLFVF